jgi:hypothetical protein
VLYKKVYSGVPVAGLLWCQPRGFFLAVHALVALALSLSFYVSVHVGSNARMSQITSLVDFINHVISSLV